jgi:hypothetical protein
VNKAVCVAKVRAHAASVRFGECLFAGARAGARARGFACCARSLRRVRSTKVSAIRMSRYSCHHIGSAYAEREVYGAETPCNSAPPSALQGLPPPLAVECHGGLLFLVATAESKAQTLTLRQLKVGDRNIGKLTPRHWLHPRRMESHTQTSLPPYLQRRHRFCIPAKKKTSVFLKSVPFPNRHPAPR